MQFAGDIAYWQRRVAEGPAGQLRRAAALQSLAPERGGRYLDLGCGGGQFLLDLASAMQGGGSVLGIDVSEEQVEAARTLCRDEANVSVTQGSATKIEIADASIDGIASVHVLEYVADLDAAFAEIARVTKPGGSVALISVLWDAFFFTGPEDSLNAEINEAWRAHCPHQSLPTAMPHFLTSVGFETPRQMPVTLFETSYDEGNTGYWVAKIMAAFVAAQGVPDETCQDWLRQLDEAVTDRRYGFLSVPVLTEARRGS